MIHSKTAAAGKIRTAGNAGDYLANHHLGAGEAMHR